MSNIASEQQSGALETPILFLIFNRPHTTRQVFEQIRKLRPKILFIAADGPRPHVPEDAAKCSQTRSIANAVDWDCEIQHLFRDENLGCGKGVSSAIDWFFEHVEEGIILEDDCLPDISFFRYCSLLLQHYRNEERVMHISGHSLLHDTAKNKDSYFFSHIATIWGWATWRRAWKKYKFELKEEDVGLLEEKLTANDLPVQKIKAIAKYIRKSVQRKVDTWDYQWLYTVLANKGLAIVPANSLVENIGFDEHATHTRKRKKHLTGSATTMNAVMVHQNELKIHTVNNGKLMGILYPSFFEKKWREFMDMIQSKLSEL